MPKLDNPLLDIKVVAGSQKRIIKATVDVHFSDQEMQFMKLFSSKYRLRCQMVGKDKGEDSGLNGGNDALFWLKSKDINKTGQYEFLEEFSSNDPNHDLDEDDQFEDEIIAAFDCRPLTSFSLAKVGPIHSSKVSGSF
jgi:hypothetical protein